MGWGYVVQRLIASGHRLQDVLDYTLDQVQLFAHEQGELDRAEAKQHLLLTRAAAAAQDDFKKVMRGLDK